MKRLFFFLPILIIAFTAYQLHAELTTLSSSSITTQIWNGSSWVAPTQIADKDANAGAPGATVVERGWGWNCFCEELGSPASATTTCSWQALYNVGSHWISDTTWDSSYTIGYTRYFRHDFTIPAGHFAKNMKVVIACDDTIDVLMDHTGNPPWSPMGSYYLGSAGGNCSLSTFDIGCVGPGDHRIQFILKNTASHYFGYIYKIEYDLVAYDDIDIEQEENCCYSGSFTYYDPSGSTLTDFTITPVPPVGGSIAINNASVTDDLLTRGWTASFSSSSASYSGGTFYNICEEVKTFHFCIDEENVNYFDLIIRYYKGGDLIRGDTIHRIPTDSCCGCDDINIYGHEVPVTSDSLNSVDCCFDFGFSSECDLPEIEFVRFTLPPGVTFASANPPSPPPTWIPESPFSLNIPTWHFPSPPGNFVAGTYQWFHFCFVNNSGSDNFPLYITFTNGNYEPICEDSIIVKCSNDSTIDYGECTSIRFDEEGRIDLPASGSYAGSGGDFTWECWFKLKSVITDNSIGWGQVLINIDNNFAHPGQDINLGFGSPVTSKDKLTFFVNNNVGLGFSIVSYKPATGFIPGRWYHVAAVMDYLSHQIRLTVYDASVDNTVNIIGTYLPGAVPITPPAGGFKPRIGHWSHAITAGNGDYFNGWIDDVRFWNTSLSLSTISYLMKKCLYDDPILPISGLQVYYPILKFESLPTILDLSGNGLNGTLTNGTLMTQLPATNAAPMKCCDTCCCCKDIDINFYPIGPDTLSQCDCCYELNFELDCDTDNMCFDNDIKTVRFWLPNGETFCSANPPSPSWTTGLPFSSSGTVTWNFPNPPGSLIPSTTYGNFTLCFNGTIPGLPFPLIVDFMDGRYEVICRDTLYPTCGTKNCCDNFDDSSRVYSWARQIGCTSYIIINGSMSVSSSGGPIKRVSATIVHAKKSSGTIHHTFSDIIAARGSNPWSWTLGAAPPSPLCGLQGINGAFSTNTPYSREIIWGDYRSTTTTANLTGCPYGMIIRFPHVPWDDDILDFGIRYEFTDTTCCTCDILINYEVPRRHCPIRRDTLLPPIKDYLDEKEPQQAWINMSSREEGILNVLNLSGKDDSNNFKIIGLKLTPEKGITVTSITDKATGENGTIENGIAKINTKINPSDIGQFDISFDKSDKDVFTCKMNIIIIFKPTTDTLILPIDDIYVHYNQGGDVIAVDTSKKLSNVNTFALYMQNLNTAEEDVAKIMIILPQNPYGVILALGSDAISDTARLDLFKTDDGTFVIPTPTINYEPGSAKHNETISPIYITIQSENQKEIILNYKTLNKHNQIISEGDIHLKPVTGIKNDLGGFGESVNLSVYPNPSKNHTTLQINSQLDLRNSSLDLVDLNGKIIMNVFDNSSIRKGINIFQLNMNSLPDGLYYIRLATIGGTYVKKIIVAR